MLLTPWNVVKRLLFVLLLPPALLTGMIYLVRPHLQSELAKTPVHALTCEEKAGVRVTIKDPDILASAGDVTVYMPASHEECRQVVVTDKVIP